MKNPIIKAPRVARYLRALGCTVCVLAGATARAGEIASFELEADGEFESRSIPEESGLSRGYARWHLSKRGESTRLDIHFSFAMSSYSWVPSFVSRFVARSALKADAEELIAGIELADRAQDDQSGER